MTERGPVSPIYHVYVSDRGNIFMTEIAALIAAGLSDLGYHTVFPAAGLPEPGRDRINVVVAPHEFFVLQRGFTEYELLKAAESSAMIGVEQPGTQWFELSAHYASAGWAVLDISPYAVDELRRRGIEAAHLQLGYHPSWDRWGGQRDQPRHIDLLFMGSMTDRRDQILASAAPLIWDCEADIRLFEFPRPMSEPRGNFVASTAKWDLLASSRVLLNIHRSQVPYFEWVRTLEAVANGCLVVSETSQDYGPLVPGEHLIAAPAEVLGAYVASIITDEPLRVEMATAAYELVRSKLELTAILDPICANLESTVRHPQARGVPMAFRPPPPGPPPNRILADAVASEMRARMRVKELLDSETALIRQVEALQARIEWGDSEHAERSVTPAWEGFVPQVSVVATSYNCEPFIAEAIESAMNSTGVAVEIIIVDDHSLDGSVGVVNPLMVAAAEFPITLVSRAANAGVARARNLGTALARSDRIFILDGDNTVYPETLKKLSDALDQAPDAALSYGILAKRDGSGLLSYLPWDTVRLCQGNYIDAMAIIRRSALDKVGGYDEYFGLLGWEDYELWLRMAAMGLRGEFVPAIVGSYRVHSTSRQHTVNLDPGALMGDLKNRYPYLPWDQG
jgi:hypothetical protein